MSDFTVNGPDRISEMEFDPGTAENRQRLYESLLTYESDEMAYQIDRPDSDTNPATTFSADAMEGLNDAVMAFVGSRIMRHWTQTGVGPKKARILITTHIE
jgi:hypothetical protein